VSEDGLTNFTNIVTVLAAFGGVVIAGFGLWTWKEQIRWQQGRGLAVSLLQAIAQIRRRVTTFHEMANPLFVEDHKREFQTSSYEDSLQLVTEELSRLEEEITHLERHSMEALILWRQPLSEVCHGVRDIQRDISSAWMTALSGVNPKVVEGQRKESQLLGYDLLRSLRGHDEAQNSALRRVKELEKKLAACLPLSKLG
jgi:hypothetical protein